MINVEIESYWDSKWLEELDWKEFQKHWPLAVEPEKPKTAYNIKGPCRISYEEAMALADMGVKLTITPLPGAMITKMKDSFTHVWETGSRINPEDLNSGKAVQISVPDMALMWIDEVTVETDCCTDALQGMLDEGWRILAVCPPNAQRRPDYVLGRVKAKRTPFDV